MRPITGTATGRLPSSSEPMLELRTRPSVPSMTLGVKPRRPLPLLPPESSGSLMTSMARARLGRRRMKPRSSSAVMRRWIPDFERKSNASFISSKEGGTPDSFRRSLMNRRSSYCLRVSISTNPQVDSAVRFQDSEFAKAEAGSSFRELQTPLLETNHEQTLYVPYVFRNHLISGQRAQVLPEPDGPAVTTAAAGYRKAIRRARRAQMAGGSQVPVPQRDLPRANCPGGRPACRPARRLCAPQDGRADSLRACRWRRRRARAWLSRGRGGRRCGPTMHESAAPGTGTRRHRRTRDCRAGR